MKKWVTIFAASVALTAFLLIGARWLLPVMGLAGVEGEAVQPLIKLMPWALLAGASAVALLLFHLKRQAAAPAYPEARRLVEEAESWSDDFLIGEELNETAQHRAIATETNVAEREEAEPAFASTGLTVTPTLARAVNKSGSLRAPRATADITNPPPDELLMNSYEPTHSPGQHNGQNSLNGAPGGSVHQLPPSLPEFAGRAFELSEFLAARANPEIKILGLQGLGGVGKTTLAVRLAHQLAPHYPDAQIFVDLKGASAQPLSVAAAQAHIIRAYLPTGRLPESESELRHLYQTILADKRALLLLDNAVNAQQIAPLIPPENCLLVITSRQHISLPRMFSSRLESLPPAEAREMLRRLLPQITHGIEPIAELCGYLPLALRLAASALTQHPDMSVGHYARHLARVQQEGTKRPIEAALRLSYELLVPGLRKLWRLLSVFPDSFDVNAAAAVWRIHPARAANALQRLMAYSLVERNRATGRFRLHDLLLHLGEARLLDTERAVMRHRHAAHFQSLLHEADALYEQGREFLKQGLDLVDLEWHNIQAGQIWAAGHIEDDRMACELCNSFPDAGRYVLDLRQHPRERIRWSEAALAAAQVLKRRKAAAKHLITLGDSYADLSEVQHAIECYEQALALVQGGKDQRGEAAALIGLGTAYYLGGGLNRAREYQEAALQIAREADAQRLVAHALGNLGVTQYSLGNPRRAIELLEQQLSLARELGDRRNESHALGGLGLAHYALGELPRASELLNEQLTITREIGDRRGEAHALSNLGSAHAGLHNYEQAVTCHEQALFIARELGDRRSEVNALGGLGIAYFQQGRLPRALEMLDRQLLIAHEIGDRRGESQALINLGEAQLAAGQTLRAIELLQQAFDLTSQIGDISGQAHALFNLSLALDKKGDRRHAIAQAETALELFEIAEHPAAETVRLQLADWK
jgi:tetratricopeptide (TPR) repeat protein